MKKLYTAAEIATMNLPGLPTTKKAILTRADKEKWLYETKIGLGGVRKMFEIPAYYQPGYKPYADEQLVIRPKTKSSEQGAAAIIECADQIANQAVNKLGSTIDPHRLSQAIQLVEAYLAENKMQVSPERKSQVVIVLYNFLKSSHAKEEIEQFLKLVA
jgi:hypothetical protein